MVDGLAHVNGDSQVRVRFAPADGSEMMTFDDSESVPLDGIGAWLSGTDLVVTGMACPHWSPTAGADSDVEAICGATRQVVLHLDLKEGKWTTVTERLDPQQVPLYPSVGDAPYALLGVHLGARMFPDGRIESLDATALPAGASETPCVGSNGAMAYATSSGADNAGLGTFALKGATWERLDAGADGEDAPSSWTSHLCTVEGFVLSHVAPESIPSYELVALGPGGSSTRTKIDPPPIDAAPLIPTMSVDAGGLLLATAPGHGATYALRDDGWQPVEGRIPDGARAQLLIGSHANWISAPDDTPGGAVAPH